MNRGSVRAAIAWASFTRSVMRAKGNGGELGRQPHPAGPVFTQPLFVDREEPEGASNEWANPRSHSIPSARCRLAKWRRS